MKLSFLIELLIVVGLVAFAASRNVYPRSPKLITADIIERQDDNTVLSEPQQTQNFVPMESSSESSVDNAIEIESLHEETPNLGASAENSVGSSEVSGNASAVNVDDQPPINKYCECSNAVCNCCRDFSLPLVPVRGPGCAEIRYINDKLSITLKYGDFVLANRKVNAGTSKPICVPLPGGFSTFCGRIYGVSRVGDDFKACLGLELRAEEELEAALRVSCFKFGERGLAVIDADPLPVTATSADDDDDDDDLFGLGGIDDDDDDDDTASDDNDDDDDDDVLGLGDDDDDDDATDTADDSGDYTGFSLLGGGLLDGVLGDDNNNNKKKLKPARAQSKNSNKQISSSKKNISDEKAKSKNDKDITENAKPAETSLEDKIKPGSTVALVTVLTPTKKKKKNPGIFESLFGDDDDDDDDDNKDDDDDDDDEKNDETSDEEEDEKDETEDNTDDENENEEDEKEEEEDTEDEKEEEEEANESSENEEDTENDEKDEDNSSETDNEVDYEYKNDDDEEETIKNPDKNKNKKKKKVTTDYLGLFSRFLSLF